MDNELISILQEYGLSHKEARMYLTLLSLGSTTVAHLAKKTHLIRTTTYDLIKSLREKGIISEMTKNKILYVEAVDPGKLIQTLDERKNKLEHLLPTLRSMRMSPSLLPVVEVHEGKEGIKSIYQNILYEQKSLLAISNTHYLFTVLPYFVPTFVKNRIKARIAIKLLTEKTVDAVTLMKQRDKKELRETRFLDKLKEIPITEYIFGDKVAILGTNPEEPVGILVRHEEFAKAQRLLFEELWEKARKK